MLPTFTPHPHPQLHPHPQAPVTVRALINQLENHDIARDNYIRSKAGDTIKMLCHIYECEVTVVIIQAINQVITTDRHTVIDFNTIEKFKFPYIVDHKDYTLHYMHYGHLNESDNILRTNDIYAKHGILHPFKKLQILFKEKGYYLQDLGTKMDKITVGPFFIHPSYYMPQIAKIYYRNYKYNEKECHDIYCRYKCFCNLKCAKHVCGFSTLLHGLDTIPSL